MFRLFTTAHSLRIICEHHISVRAAMQEKNRRALQLGGSV